MNENHRHHRLLGHAAILTTAVLWGSLIPLLDILLAHIDLFALSMIRYDIAGLLLLGGVALTSGTAWLRGLPYGKVLLLGVVGMAGFATFYTLAIAYSAPGMAIVINAATPIISAVFAAAVYRMPFEKGTGLAFLLAAIGAAISSLGREGASYAFDVRGGELFLVIAAICWTWYSINAQSWLAGLRQSQITAVTLAAGGIGVTAVFLVAAGSGAAHLPAHLPGNVLALLVFISLGATLTGVICWNFAVGRLGVIIASLYLNLLPVIGMITAAAIGHAPTAMQLIGGGIVIIGLAQLQLRRLRALPQRYETPPAPVAPSSPSLATRSGHEGDDDFEVGSQPGAIMSGHNAIEDAGPKATRPVVGKLGEKDLPEAARIVRLAFGTFLGAPDPDTFWADRDYVYGRQPASHVASFGATLDGELVGSNFATSWGSVGFFGPLTVHPDVQERGIAQALLAKTMEQFDAWNTRHVGLFTFAQSAKHIALYQKYGFYARFLTAIMSAKAVRQTAQGWSRFSALSDAQREQALRWCREVAETVYPGLDLTGEIAATHAQGLGDIVLVEGAGGIAAFAVCHYGPHSEGGADTCFVKFGAVRDGRSADQDFLRLLEACEALAVVVGVSKLLAGANMARHEAYRHLVARGFRTEIQGVAMHRHNDPGYCRPGAYIIDDWR